MSTGYKPVDFKGAPVIAQQQFASGSDINNIVKKYKKDRDPTPFMGREKGNYGDFTGIKDFQTIMNRVCEANEMFMELDPAVREKFGNKVENLIEAIAQGKVDLKGMEIKAPENKGDKGQGEQSPPKPPENPKPPEEGKEQG